MYYYFKLSNGKYYKLSIGSQEVVHLTELFAGILGMTCDKPDDDLIQFENIVYSMDYFEKVSAKYQDYQLFSRKTGFRFLFNDDFTKCISFINPVREYDKTINYLSVTNIHVGMQVQILQNYKATPCHCALVEINGKGAIIGAVGNTGKSTCAKRLPSPYKALSDDYAMLYFDGNKITAQAMPTFSNFINGDLNYKHDCSQIAEIEAFFFLKQSDGDWTERVNGSIALHHLNNNFQDLLTVKLLIDKPENVAENLRVKLFELAQEAIESRPTYMLNSTLHGDFWNKMADVL